MAPVAGVFGGDAFAEERSAGLWLGFDLCPAHSLATLVGLVVEDDDREAACDQARNRNRKKAVQENYAGELIRF